MWFKSNFTIQAVVAISFCIIGGTVPVAADILHVPGDYLTIQEAIDAAMDGDEVEVHPGTYNETIDFLGKAITVYSTDGRDVTIIDAQQTGTVVTCNSGEGPDTVLNGFTVMGGEPSGMRNVGSSPTVTNCTFTGNTAFGGGGDGGGMFNRLGSSPTVTNCTFSGNSADDRGGGMSNSNSSPTVTNCTFTENSATGNNSRGGGMYNFDSSPTVTNCTFSGNSANSFGGGMYNLGAGSSPTVINCTFSGNMTGLNGTGGGMRNDGSSPTVINCTFSGNSTNFGGGMLNAGGSSPTLINCTFSGNIAINVGGGMYNSVGCPTLINCTFSGNIAEGSSGGAIYNVVSSPTVTNCILWGDSPNEIANFAGAMPIVSYSNVQGGWPGTGNIDVDPLLVDPDNEDYHLSLGSPSIDAGNNWGVPIDERDYDEDGVLCELFPVDLDGNPRFNADEADFDPGCGVPVVVDMGAYEYQFDPVEQIIFADLTADGAVNTLDLLSLFAEWGPCAKGCCLADLDIDGSVNTNDLLILFANWGPCP